MNRCPAHGNESCYLCTRIASHNIRKDEGRRPECDGCDYWGATGMHWDTCPNRIRGDIVAHPIISRGRW